jgi:hypothetical protein
MTSLPYRKGTVLIPSGPTPHLHIICNDPVFYPGNGKESILAVNVSSIKPNILQEEECLLSTGDHPFIRHSSFIMYSRADIFGAVAIARSIDDGTFTPHDPASEELFTRILAGFESSERVKYKVLRFYERYCRSSSD